MRTFAVNKLQKIFRGDKVLDVAKRVAKYLFSKTSKTSIKYTMKEVTKEGKGKSYKYIAKKTESKTIVKRVQKMTGGNTNYVYLYDTKNKKYITYLHGAKGGCYNTICYGDNIVLSNKPQFMFKIVDKEQPNANVFQNIKDQHFFQDYHFITPNNQYFVYNSDDREYVLSNNAKSYHVLRDVIAFRVREKNFIKIVPVSESLEEPKISRRPNYHPYYKKKINYHPYNV